MWRRNIYVLLGVIIRGTFIRLSDEQIELQILWNNHGSVN